MTAPVGRRAPDTCGRVGNLLNDLRITFRTGGSQSGTGLAEVIDVQEVDRALLALLHQQLISRARRRQQQQTPRADILIVAVECGLVVGSEVIENGEPPLSLWPELHDTVAEIGPATPVAIAGRDVHIPESTGGDTAPTHPNAARTAVGRCVEDSLLRESRGTVGHHPAVPRVCITVRAPADDHVTL